jgi:hypothetical protein
MEDGFWASAKPSTNPQGWGFLLEEENVAD